MELTGSLTDRFYLGLSGGHTKSVAVAYDAASGALTNKVYGQAINIHRLPRTEVIRRLDNILFTLARELGLQALTQLQTFAKKAVFAFPGAGHPYDIEVARHIVEQQGWARGAFVVLDDTWAGLYEMTLQERGICAFAGTGASVCVAQGQFGPGKVLKFDGWGPIIGDFGSSFQLAVDFFRMLRRRLDNEASCLLLARIVADFEELKGPEGVQPWLDHMLHRRHEDWSAEFAKFAQTITKAARDPGAPDADACELVRNCAAQMAETINIAIQRASARSLPLVLQGGLFLNSSLYRDTVRKTINNHCGDVRVGREGPVVGALFYALSDMPEHVAGLQARPVQVELPH
jgi:N-acetylglucosamine kinase-like BadF-type ATPase